MKSVIPLLGLLAVLFVRVGHVAACSRGPESSIHHLLEYRDTVVYATVLEVDDRGQNAILQVDRYFKGRDGEYLTVMRYPAALEYAAGIRQYDTGCLYDGGDRTPWVAGTSGYFLLSDNGNGTYEDTNGKLPNFFVQDGRIEYYDFEVNDSGTVSANVEEFEAILLASGNRESAIAPDPDDSAYPLRRFLNITTETGQRYQLNPDRTLTKLPDDYPIALSPDGSHVAFRLDDAHIGFQYYWLEQDYDELIGRELPQPQPGQALLFSPDSDYVAVWNAQQMLVVMFDNYERGGYGQRMTMQTIAQTELQWSTDTLPTAEWSADSTTLAYTDEQGIWQWNIFEDAEPELIVPADDTIPALLDLSRSGRYIRYGTNAAWALFDTRTGETYDNAIATPDEHNLIYIRADFPENTPDIDRRGNRECAAPLAATCPIYIQQPDIISTFWFKYNQIAVLSCREEFCYVESYSWKLAASTTAYVYGTKPQLLVPSLRPVNAFAYDEFYDQPVIVTNDDLLAFGFYLASTYEEYPDTLDLVDLTGQVDSPIVSVEWGQPTFYDHRLP